MKQHYYLFNLSFPVGSATMFGVGVQTVDTAYTLPLKNNYVVNKDLIGMRELVASDYDTPSDNVMVKSVSYLGEMTEAEFKGELDKPLRKKSEV